VRSYHHGNLRDAILVAAASVIARDGVGSLSLRAIAGDLGVTHTAFRRHFGDREGVLNALAVQGHRLLAAELRAAQAGEFLDVGVAYVHFALTNPGHFTVMFRPDLLDNGDPELAAARSEAFAPLSVGVAALDVPDPVAARVAGWGLVHGIATLALTGNLASALRASGPETHEGRNTPDATKSPAHHRETETDAHETQPGSLESKASNGEGPAGDGLLGEQGVEALARRALALLYSREIARTHQE
jgi:AcrR family transcriptional regulator